MKPAPLTLRLHAPAVGNERFETPVEDTVITIREELNSNSKVDDMVSQFVRPTEQVILL